MSAEFAPDQMDVFPDPNQQPTHPLDQYERLVVFYNPASRHAEGLPADIDHLRQARPGKQFDVYPYETDPDPKRNLERVRNIVQEGDIVVARAGDGGVSSIQDGVHGLDFRVPILVRPTGNANDQAHQEIDDHFFHDPGAVLRRHELRQVYPLEATFTSEGRVLAKNIWGYAGFGADALAGHWYNLPSYRKSRWHTWGNPGTFVKERLTAVHSIAAIKPFEVIGPDANGNQTSQLVVERIIAAGSRMAKDFKIHADLFDEYFRVIDGPNKLRAAVMIAKLMAGRETGYVLDGDQGLEFTVKSPIVFAEVDGEDYQFLEEVAVSILRSRRSIDVFTALPKRS